jgi:hypothetical protein
LYSFSVVVMHRKRVMWSLMIISSHNMITTSCLFRHNSISWCLHLVTKCRKHEFSRSDTFSSHPQVRRSTRIWVESFLWHQLFIKFSLSEKCRWNFTRILSNFCYFFWRFLTWYPSRDSSFARCSQLLSESSKTSQYLQIWVSQNRYPSPRSFPTQRDADTPISGV